MPVVQKITEPREAQGQVPLHDDYFLCPVCGNIGVLGKSGFMLTDRPAWFRCESCQYVFEMARRRSAKAAGVVL